MMRPAAEKRQGTKSRDVGGVAVPRGYGDFTAGSVVRVKERSGGEAHLASWVGHDGGAQTSSKGFARRDFACFGHDDAPIRCGGASIEAVGGEPTQAANVIGAVVP